MIQWIVTNKEWIFSGIGIAAIAAGLKFFSKDKGAINQKIGNNSTGIQAGRDVNLKFKDGKK